MNDSSRSERRATVVVYSRPGCHLCEEALEAIVAIHGEGYRFELREVDIESDENLLRRLLERIPVVEVDGVVVSELLLDQAALRARLDTVESNDGAGS
jgi:glutaredoxin